MKSLERVDKALPEWMRSARFRLTVLYSTVLFLIAALLMGTLYMALSKSLTGEMMLKQDGISRPFVIDEEFEVSEDFVVTSARDLVRLVNEQALANLREFSFAALGVLFLVSLCVGWVISGRVLAPIDRITGVANEIQATDLSRRIKLQGPSDELKRLADTFDQMLARLDAAFSSHRRFIADASHELRNPLAVIKTNLDVVLADPNATKSDLEQAALVVRRASERMSRLVDDLLALARLERRGTHEEVVEVPVVAREVAEELSALASQRAIKVALAPSIDIPVRGDREALKRAVANLVDNAITFAPQGSTVTIATGLEHKWAWVAVADQGPGIDVEDQGNIFDRFWRADKSRSRSRGGSGLGLAIVKQIAESHSGAVRLFSTPGRGSTFVVWIPAPPGTEEEGGQDRSVPEGSPLARVATA